MGFTIVYTDDCYKWLDQLPRSDRMRVLARVDLIAEQGPGLGRPVVETIKASRHQNMKELRSGTWHRRNIPLADDLYDEWLVELKKDKDS